MNQTIHFLLAYGSGVQYLFRLWIRLSIRTAKQATGFILPSNGKDKRMTDLFANAVFIAHNESDF